MTTGQRRTTRMLALVAPVLMGLALGVLPACGKDAAPVDRRVTVVGDSLSVLGDAEIRQQLEAAGWNPLVDAYAGRTVATQAAALTKAAHDTDQAVVIELGTNDAHALAQGETDVEAERGQVRQALDQFSPRQCLVWVNADADPSRPGLGGGKLVDDIVQAEAANRTNVHIADLNALLQAHPEYLAGDDVHLTTAGSVALGRLMADTLAECG